MVEPDGVRLDVSLPRPHFLSGVSLAPCDAAEAGGWRCTIWIGIEMWGKRHQLDPTFGVQSTPQAAVDRAVAALMERVAGNMQALEPKTVEAP